MGGYGDSGVEGEAVPIHSERLRRARSLWCQRLRQSRIGDGECALASLVDWFTMSSLSSSRVLLTGIFNLVN